MSQMPIGKYIYCTTRTFQTAGARQKRHKCLSASTFTVPLSKGGFYGTRVVTNAYRQVHLLYPLLTTLMTPSPQSSQMPIGKYIYCTPKQVIILTPVRAMSQMPIGKYIYCTRSLYQKCPGPPVSQMPIGKYIYCTQQEKPQQNDPLEGSQMPIGKYIYCTIKKKKGTNMAKISHKCLSASTFTVPFLFYFYRKQLLIYYFSVI